MLRSVQYPNLSPPVLPPFPTIHTLQVPPLMLGLFQVQLDFFSTLCPCMLSIAAHPPLIPQCSYVMAQLCKDLACYRSCDNKDVCSLLLEWYCLNPLLRQNRTYTCTKLFVSLWCTGALQACWSIASIIVACCVYALQHAAQVMQADVAADM